MTKKEKIVFERIMALKIDQVCPKGTTRTIKKAVFHSQLLLSADHQLFKKLSATCKELDQVMNSAKLPNCIQVLLLFGLTREAVHNIQHRGTKKNEMPKL